MTYIDLTYPMHNGMPVYPGTTPPEFTNAFTIANDGFAEKILSMLSHTGTHMDAPAHIIPNAKTLDQFPVSHFTGTARILDVASFAGKEIPDTILTDEILHQTDYLLLRSGWNTHWGDDAYMDGFPVMSEAFAAMVAASAIRGVGLDMISVDPVGSTELPIHHVLLGAGKVIIENLANLDPLPLTPFRFTALPLALVDADGSSVRAMAEV